MIRGPLSPLSPSSRRLHEQMMKTSNVDARFDVWQASRAGRLSDLKTMLHRRPDLLDAKDVHNNTPLYYAWYESYHD